MNLKVIAKMNRNEVQPARVYHKNQRKNNVEREDGGEVSNTKKGLN